MKTTAMENLTMYKVLKLNTAFMHLQKHHKYGYLFVFFKHDFVALFPYKSLN